MSNIVAQIVVMVPETSSQRGTSSFLPSPKTPPIDRSSRDSFPPHPERSWLPRPSPPVPDHRRRRHTEPAVPALEDPDGEGVPRSSSVATAEAGEGEGVCWGTRTPRCHSHCCYALGYALNI